MNKGVHIEVRGLKKVHCDLVAVDGVGFDVREGRVFSLRGPNGAGRTTMVEILGCLRSASSGDVRILGYGPDQGLEIKKRIGVLPQGFNAFDLLTVKENVDHFAGMFQNSVDNDELLRWVKLDDLRKELFKNLSGGMEQRSASRCHL